MSTTALITGGTSGIGRAVANKLAQLGIHTLVVGRNEERGQKTIAEIRAAGGQANFISSDLRDASSARHVARRAIELGNGHIDILINNAGVYPFGSTHETSEELFDKVYSLNVKVPYFLVAELAPLMAKRGRGAIVISRPWLPITERPVRASTDQAKLLSTCLRKRGRLNMAAAASASMP